VSRASTDIHVPMRTCIGCRQVAARSDLQRWIAVPAHAGTVDVVHDERGAAHGRGAWLHDDAGCRDRAVSSGAFKRALRIPSKLAPMGGVHIRQTETSAGM
jgi:predicted RNA-binding protein YlxR (DUF448 family)